MSGAEDAGPPISQATIAEDIAALRKMPVGGLVATAVGTYAMQGESVRGERRWHSLMFAAEGRSWCAPRGTPDSGRPDAVRRFAVRHYRDQVAKLNARSPPEEVVRGST